MAKTQQRILIIGVGFAGMWSALAARRAIANTEGAAPIEVAVLAPEDKLVIRPRLYENGPENMCVSLTDLFATTGVRFIQGTVDTINTAGREVGYVDAAGTQSKLTYDRLVMAAGSRLVRPNIPGLVEHAFSIDRIEEAIQLDEHLMSLAKLPPSAARNTAVVCGGGFTGIELAAELPARMRSILGEDADIRVVVVERAEDIGPELGAGPRPAIIDALQSLGVEMKLGSAVASLDSSGLTTSSGERIETMTAAWTAGVAATALTKQIPSEKDRFGRLHVDENLRVKAQRDVFAAGDTAYASTDNKGNHALMSCQHAIVLGRTAGHNVAADLLGIPFVPYSQVQYGTCLDLGPAGAVVTDGWEREQKIVGADAKLVKKFVNGMLIYPPKADVVAALAAADPEWKVPKLDLEMMKASLQVT